MSTRFFEDKNVCDRDLLALKLDPTVDIRAVLVKKALIARAEKIYIETFTATERELGKEKRSVKKLEKLVRASHVLRAQPKQKEQEEVAAVGSLRPRCTITSAHGCAARRRGLRQLRHWGKQ